MPNSRARAAFCSPAAARFHRSAACSATAISCGPGTLPVFWPGRCPSALALADQSAFKFGKRPHYREHQICHGRVLAGEGQAFLDELDADPPFGQLLHQAAQVVEGSCQTIHAVHDHRVALAGEGKERLELRPLEEHGDDFETLSEATDTAMKNT